MKKKEKEKEKELWKAAAWDMLYLVQCGINGFVPEEKRIKAMDLEKVYLLSKSQSLEALTCMALGRRSKETPLADEKKVLARWEESKNKAIRKNMLMDAARAKLFAWLEEKGIWHVALKGAVLATMYPEYGMRQMSDNDILFDPAFRQEVHDWFVEQGYEVKSFGKSNHDEYQKKPVYNFEMHVSLFSKDSYPKFMQYYLELKDRLVMAPGKKFEYHMSDEDSYLYMLAHEYKHYSDNGIGLRSLVDLYVYYWRKEDLNYEYLNTELEKMELFVFEKEMRELAKKVFNLQENIGALSRSQKNLIDSLIFSNTYGNRKNFWYGHIGKAQKIGKKVSVKIKLRYLMCQIFPGRTYMERWCQQRALCFLQYRWLMPIAYIWRIIKTVVEKKEQVKAEFDMIRKA